ncbi:hypothetical protein [Kordia sp.]|uniref:hypothetical protein n=1 Tax=Kordia sp. TaxID=1965332 RepID=UPI003D2E4CA5
MKNLKKLALVLFLGVAFQGTAQETTKETPIFDEKIENFELPTFSKLSNDIATDYTKVFESLPDLSNIGAYVDKELRRSFPFEHSTAYTIRNFSNENSILPNISPIRFELRNILNNIMFTGFDANQLHMTDAHKTTGN